jgi:hypothetical protein
MRGRYCCRPAAAGCRTRELWPLVASDLAFSLDLSPGTRRRIARAIDLLSRSASQTRPAGDAAVAAALAVAFAYLGPFVIRGDSDLDMSLRPIYELDPIGMPFIAALSAVFALVCGTASARVGLSPFGGRSGTLPEGQFEGLRRFPGADLAGQVEAC